MSTTSTKIPKIPSSRCLWKVPTDDKYGKRKNKNNKETYESILQQFTNQPPAWKSWTTLWRHSLVVGQEFALTCLFWARHRATLWELQGIPNSPLPFISTAELQQRMVRSQLWALAALVVIAIFANLQPQAQARKEKVQQRTSDAIFLAVLLRMLASVLRTLTASFSTDTVESLTIAGMVVHWLTCDYSYANANESRHNLLHLEKQQAQQPQQKSNQGKTSLDIRTGTNPITSTTATPPTSTIHLNSTNRRPTFQGGTVSLNAAFFSTVLLASRLDSNATVYIFVSSAIILFAFFPAARHAISHHPHCAMVHLVVTVLVSLSTCCLLRDTRECLRFGLVLWVICGLAPTWKYVLQNYKRNISGPWDVVSEQEMMLHF